MARALFWSATADFLQRVRSKGFLVAALAMVVVATLYLPALDAPYATVTVGGDRGLYDSAWIGAVTACLNCAFFSLAAFYLVRGSVGRDEETRFGQILAATPVGKVEYVLGKTLSNFAYLATLTGIIALSGAAIQLVRAEDLAVNPVELLLPTVIVAWPVMLLISAVAVLFECVPLLGGGLGSVAYFALYVGVVVLSLTPGVHSSAPDPLGVRMALEQMARSAGAAPNMGINPAPPNLGTFDFGGLGWDAAELVSRLAWSGAAIPMVLAAAAFFSRFDPARGPGTPSSKPFWRRRPAAAPDATDRSRPHAARSTPPSPMSTAHAKGGTLLTPLVERSVRERFVPLVLAELRLMLKGRSRWWHFGALGLVVAGFAVPLETARGVVLPLAWLWPLLVWSPVGSREVRYGVSEILVSAPRVRSRAPLAAFTAGAIVAGLAASGVALNMGLSGDLRGLVALVSGALFVSALAVACGVLSGASVLFEGLYLPLWYLGPFNKLPALDFAGAGGAGHPLTYLALAAALVCATLAARRRRSAGRSARRLWAHDPAIGKGKEEQGGR